ncbi:MAG: tRNA (adenosine(37)-N6)-dimethylallyltransferase MiaA [Oscillospiraceae bacterium]|nr:tRNA (adenosine(37)-N6)-dimethylallyltransferase MiaA [Oscillospiraceae bacterium]
MTEKKQPLLVVAGPTASGKTAAGIALAKEYGGEIVSADSMQIYKGLDIATAKPTPNEMDGIPHHLISEIDMGVSFSVADYIALARQKIADIAERGKLPILVGGTGLYINSLIDNVNFDTAETDGSVRARLEKEAEVLGKEEMHEMLRIVDPETAAAVPSQNIVRVIRALEVYELTGMTFGDYKRMNMGKNSPYKVCMIGLNFRERSKLYYRIDRRVTLMAENGMVEECRLVYENEKLGTVCQAIGYKELIPYFDKKADLESCLDKIRQSSRRYAKRQLTWFRRDERINWIFLDEIYNFDEIIEICKKIVAKSKILCYNDN